MADTQSKEVTVTGLTFEKVSVSFDKSSGKVSGMSEKTSDGRFKPINPVGNDFNKIIQQDVLVTEYNINKFKGGKTSWISDSSKILTHENHIPKHNRTRPICVWFDAFLFNSDRDFVHDCYRRNLVTLGSNVWRLVHFVYSGYFHQKNISPKTKTG